MRGVAPAQQSQHDQTYLLLTRVHGQPISLHCTPVPPLNNPSALADHVRREAADPRASDESRSYWRRFAGRHGIDLTVTT